MIHPEFKMKACPSYERCHSPICPLETAYPSSKRYRFPEEARCVANKPTRFRLGDGLKFHGLFAKEYQGLEAADGLAKYQKGVVLVSQPQECQENTK